MIRFYDLANDSVRVCHQDGSDARKFDIEKDEAFHVSHKVEPPSWTEVYTVVTWTNSDGDEFCPICRAGQFILAWKSGPLADILNKWNAFVIKSGNPLYLTYDETDATKVRIVNTSMEHVLLKNVATFRPFESLSIPLERLFRPMNTTWPVVVLQEEPVLSLRAFLFRKKDKGYYTRDELVSLPCGIYWTIEAFVATLNERIQMRGERNGFIYSFSVTRDGRLQMNAVHRQPKNSYIDVVPTSNVLGLCEQSSLILRTKGKLTFQNEVCL